MISTTPAHGDTDRAAPLRARGGRARAPAARRTRTPIVQPPRKRTKAEINPRASGIVLDPGTVVIEVI